LAKIHPLAVVDPQAEIADDVSIGPFSYIEAGVRIGRGCQIDSHVTMKSGTILGEENYVAQGAVLGGDPQDRKFGEDMNTLLVIGDRNVIREYCTIHRATGDGKQTTIGNDCYIMAYTHVGHNGTIGNFVTLANNVGLAGHVTIEDYVTFGGMVGVHQFCRIGKSAMVGAMSGVGRDVPPFTVAAGRDLVVLDINAVGLRRIGITQEARLAIHKAVKLLFKSELGLSRAIETVRREVQMTPEVEYLLAFEERRFKGKNGRGDQP